MVNLVEARHTLSLKYDIAAGDLDESIVPLMIGISKISDELEKSLVAYDLQVKNIEKLMNQRVPQIYCDKPKTALLVGIGKYGSISLAVSIFLSVFWIGLVILKSNHKEYDHFEDLSKVVKYDTISRRFFIGKENFNKVKGGIVLIKK
jgi:hypothetical protein